MDRDSDGTLFDPKVRAAMTQFTAGEDTLQLEAASAIRAATHAIERMRSLGSHSRTLSSGALDLLLRLSTAPEGVSVKDLAQSASVSSRNVTGLVDTLERDGLAQRTPDRNDRRSVLVTITPAGRDWVESFRGPAQAGMAAIFQRFSVDELTQLRHLCLRLVDNHRLISEHMENR